MFLNANDVKYLIFKLTVREIIESSLDGRSILFVRIFQFNNSTTCIKIFFLLIVKILLISILYLNVLHRCLRVFLFNIKI